MSLAGCQINLIEVNFPKKFGNFDKNSADKIWSKKDKEWKVFPLMPIRVKGVSVYKPWVVILFEKSEKVFSNFMNHIQNNTRFIKWGTFTNPKPSEREDFASILDKKRGGGVIIPPHP